MAFYETVFIARQELSPAQTEELAKQFTSVVNDNGGKVERTEHWGLRQLAYKINKNKKGNYVLFHISGNGATIAELERIMRLNEDVLRFMTVALEELPSGPTIMMQDNDDNDSAPSGRTRSGRAPRKETSFENDSNTEEGEE